MNSPRRAVRELVLLTLPVAFMLVLGSYLTRHPLPDSPAPLPTVRPTPIPTTFRIEFGHFQATRHQSHSAKWGILTRVSAVTVAYNHPPNLVWRFARRLVATKSPRSRVLWHDSSNPLQGPLVLTGGVNGIPSKLEFRLRDVPYSAGELTFVWDMLAQPVSAPPTDSIKYVSVAELDRAARWGGLRVTRRLVLRRARPQ